MEKFYTVDDIAKIAMVTARTVRNYLKDGLLTGRKIGGQWRFTDEDLNKFFERGEILDVVRAENRQEILDFLDGNFAEYSGEVQICCVIDIYRPIAKIENLQKELMRLGEGNFRYRFNYDNAEEKARFSLFGTPEYIGAAMEKIKNEEDV